MKCGRPCNLKPRNQTWCDCRCRALCSVSYTAACPTPRWDTWAFKLWHQALIGHQIPYGNLSSKAPSSVGQSAPQGYVKMARKMTTNPKLSKRRLPKQGMLFPEVPKWAGIQSLPLCLSSLYPAVASLANSLTVSTSDFGVAYLWP